MTDDDQYKNSWQLGMLLALATLPIAIFFEAKGKTDLGLTLGLIVAINIFSIGVYWHLRRKWWLWAGDAVILIVHIWVAQYIKWPNHWVPGIALLPIVVADAALTVGLLRVLVNISGAGEFVPDESELLLRSDPSEQRQHQPDIKWQ